VSYLPKTHTFEFLTKLAKPLVPGHRSPMLSPTQVVGFSYKIRGGDHQLFPTAANREAMCWLMTRQNEAASCGPVSASRLTALLSAASIARCAAGLNCTCSKSSLIRRTAVNSLVSSGSDDRARNRNASKHVSKLMTDSTFCSAACSVLFSLRIHISTVQKYACRIFAQNLRGVTLPVSIAHKHVFGARKGSNKHQQII
jgi:hypothetical protein